MAFHRSTSKTTNMARTRSARPAYTFILSFSLICILAAASLLFQDAKSTNANLRKRSFLTTATRTSASQPQCTDIHRATDQCAFMVKYCEDEDTGIISYLSLYFCKLPHLKPIAFVIIATWASLLFATIGIAASDFFSVNLQSISSLLNMSENLAGVTFLAFGNGGSDLFSTWAAMGHHSGSLAIGELIGAAGFITAVVPAAMIFVKPFRVGSRTFVRDICFFAVAIGFSMTFLANGHLELWESLVMIGFYALYVSVVMAHYWRMSRRRARREREAAARAHYVQSGSFDTDVLDHLGEGDAADGTQYLDNDDTSGTITRTISNQDFDDLESADVNRHPDDSGDVDEEEPELRDEEERDRVLSEISNNMRIARPAGRPRRAASRPIRPSLIGALEFQAVLSSLRDQQNIPVIPPDRRRRLSYSPDRVRFQPRRGNSTLSDTDIATGVQTQSRTRPTSPSSNVSLNPDSARQPLSDRIGPNRTRAVSASDAANLRFDPAQIVRPPPNRGRSVESPKVSIITEISSEDEDQPFQKSRSPLLSVSPPPPNTQHEDKNTPELSQTPTFIVNEPGMLAPPQPGEPSSFTSKSYPSSPARMTASPLSMSPELQPRPQLKISPPSTHLVAKVSSETQARLSSYHDDPNGDMVEDLLLPDSSEPMLSSRTPLLPADKSHFNAVSKPLRWWPDKILPTPSVIFCTLFPSLKMWSRTNVIGKMIALASVPSVLLLTLTLPVVEFERLTGQTKVNPNTADPTVTRSSSLSHTNMNAGSTAHASNAVSAITTERTFFGSESGGQCQNSACVPTEQSPQGDWNRWLLILQCFLAPLFVILVSWAGDEDASTHVYIHAILYAMLGSSVVTFVLLLVTTQAKPPRWQSFLSFVGFGVSVFWISTIAEEVVGVLKAIGVIFNISDAILGLTIFAVGNSLGDLVADVTVARLGYPVMALSACFGGPMMNILIGIGVAGAWNAWKGEEKYHHKHPERPRKWKSYHLEVDVTLMISAVALLITLLCYLIVVPLNKWKLDRKIAVGLVTIWVIATIINIVIEVTGIGGKLNYHHD